MSVARTRKTASKRLGLELEKRYRRLVLAGNDAEEITEASVELGGCFNDNIEFIIWVLKVFGGLNPPRPELTTRTPKPAISIVPPDQVTLPELPKELTGLANATDVIPKGCTCPPLEAGIIGRDRHMTSCPEYRV